MTEEEYRQQQRDEERRAQQQQWEDQQREAGSAEQAYYDSDEYRSDVMGASYPNPNEPANQYSGGGAGGAEDVDFGQALEDKLREILDLDAAERARNEAGRALLAARSQAGRGQMGMSGAMLGLQSDVMGEAALRAEDYLIDQQIDAARTGVKLEAMDRAEQLGLIDWVRSSQQQGNSEDQIRAMLEGLGLEAADIEALISGATPEVVEDTVVWDPSAQAAWTEMSWSPPDGSWWESGNNTGVDAGVVVPPGTPLPSNVTQTTWFPTNAPRKFSIGVGGEPHYRYEYEDTNGVKHYFYVPA